MAFKYDKYTQSKDVTNLATELAKHDKTKQADWTGGTYGSSLADALSKIQNRQKFSYDLNGDALYQQYKDQYMTQGKLAMQDTIGQASALTGGYDNSYANTAGQQTYQGYLQQLNDKVPELYQMAYTQYAQEGQDLKDNYGLISDMYGKEYGEYQDRNAQWNADRDYLSGRYDNERNYDYSKYSDDRDFSFNNYQQGVSEKQYADNLAYQKARDAVADAQWNKQYNLSVNNSKKTTTTSPKKATTTEEKPKAQPDFDNGMSKGDVAKAAAELYDAHPDWFLNDATIDYWMNDNEITGKAGQYFKACLQNMGMGNRHRS